MNHDFCLQLVVTRAGVLDLVPGTPRHGKEDVSYGTWEPEEQYQWKQFYHGKWSEPMDLKRAISRVETIARRPSWANTEQKRALAAVVEAAKKQLPPEPEDTLTLLNNEDERGWFLTAHNGGKPLTEKRTRELHEGYNAPMWKVVFVKVPV